VIFARMPHCVGSRHLLCRGHSFRHSTSAACSSDLALFAPICFQRVNTNSQIGTVQNSYPALSCPVKFHLAALPAPATPPNSFPFCVRFLSTPGFGFHIRSARPVASIFDFRVSLFESRRDKSFIYRSLAPSADEGYARLVANSFIYRSYAKSLFNSFIYRSYTNHPGCIPSRKKKSTPLNPASSTNPQTPTLAASIAL
jgi:hypothetical protein